MTRPCPVTIYRPTDIANRTLEPGPCGEPVVDEFCARHQADADRLRAKYGRAT